ncbi:MAG TPA: DUF6502 family protein [Caldimonas sp.]|nr:DUF6502 family protein [Caldimonas sp.]
MTSRHSIVEAGVLRVMRPLARLLVRHGVTYPAFAAALKRVFLDAATDELEARGMAQTDSAVSLLSGVHRRDVRNFTRAPERASPAARGKRAGAAPLSLVGEVVARWLTDAAWQDRRRRPRALQRTEFDALVAAVSSDVRGRAMLDELVRLGAVVEGADGIALASDGFAPRQGFAEMSELFAANLAYHASAASANLQGEANFLEQAMYVDRLTPESVQRLQRVARRAWTKALPPVLAEAQACSDADVAKASAAGDAATAGAGQRVRFGVYFYSTEGAEP